MANNREVAAGFVLTWATAVDQQARRALDEAAPSADRLVHAMLFAFALRGLLRSATFLRDSTPDKAAKKHINKGIQQFEQDVPNAQLVRDALEHFDEYSIGEGTKQDEEDPWPFRLKWENTSQGVLRVGPEVMLSVASANEAASALHFVLAKELCATPAAAEPSTAATTFVQLQ